MQSFPALYLSVDVASMPDTGVKLHLGCRASPAMQSLPVPVLVNKHTDATTRGQASPGVQSFPAPVLVEKYTDAITRAEASPGVQGFNRACGFPVPVRLKATTRGEASPGVQGFTRACGRRPAPGCGPPCRCWHRWPGTRWLPAGPPGHRAAQPGSASATCPLAAAAPWTPAGAGPP